MNFLPLSVYELAFARLAKLSLNICISYVDGDLDCDEDAPYFLDEYEEALKFFINSKNPDIEIQTLCRGVVEFNKRFRDYDLR